MRKLNNKDIIRMLKNGWLKWSHLSEEEQEEYGCTIGTLGFIEELAEELEIDLRDIDPEQIDAIHDLIIYE